MPITDPERKREYGRTWVAQRRADFFRDKSCMRCGATTELQLHHRNKATKVASLVWSWTQKRREAEIAKCDILCGPCHRRHHAAERRMHIKHGTYSAYDTLNCRCKRCRAASAAYRQELRERRRTATAP